MRLGESCPHLVSLSSIFGIPKGIHLPEFDYSYFCHPFMNIVLPFPISDLPRCYIKCSPDLTNIMTKCPLGNQASFPLLEQESGWDYAPHRAQLSVDGKQVLDPLLVLLSSHLESQLSASRVSLFSPAFLLSICDVLRARGFAMRGNVSALPFVLGRLRDWRLLDANYRCSSVGIRRLALDLTGIVGEASTSTGSNCGRTSHGRLRMKWVGLDPPSEALGQEPSRSIPRASSSPKSSALDSAPKCAHVLADFDRCRPDSAHEFCLVGRLGTPDSEDSSAVGSRSSHAASGFRSGCSACRHPRVSGASTPPSPLITSQRTLFGDANQFDTFVGTSVVLPRHPKAAEQRVMARKPKMESNKFLQSPRGTHVDENKPPLIGTHQTALGITFPRQRTHFPRISNTSSSREPAATCAQRRVEPSCLPKRPREGDKRMSSHRVASPSVDLARHTHPPRHASPIDLHPQPNRAQSLSSTSPTSHAAGSVSRNPKLSSNAVSRSGKQLPFWKETHHRDPTTTTTRSAILKPDTSSASPAKARSQHTSSRPSTPSRFPSDVRGALPRPVSSLAHRHTQSAGSALPSPRLATRKWQV